MLAQILLLGVLFFVLTPGVFFTLPQDGSPYVIATIHMLIFVLVYRLVGQSVVERLNQI